MTKGIYTPDVIEILDLFYQNDGEEPDWADIKTRLFLMTDSHYTVIIGLLRAFHAIYETPTAFRIIQQRLEMDLPDS